MDITALPRIAPALPETTERTEQVRRTLRQLWAAVQLSWKIEANWTNLYIFSLFSIIKPLSSALIVILIYIVGARAGGGMTPATSARLSLLVVGFAFYDFWVTGFTFHSQVLLNDRERFETLKYLKIAPLNWYWFVWVRGLSRMGLSAVNATVMLAIGLAFFPLPSPHFWSRLPLLLLVLVVGWIGVLAMGATLATLFLLLSWQAAYIGTILSATVLLVSGVLFPLETLPGWAQSIGQVLPPTLWLDLIRHILSGTTLSAVFAHMSTGQLFLRLLISVAVVCLVSIPCMAWSHKQLIKYGRVEVRTGA